MNDKPPPPAPWSSLVSGLWIAILPPLVLLALGAALGWVFSRIRHGRIRQGASRCVQNRARSPSPDDRMLRLFRNALSASRPRRAKSH